MVERIVEVQVSKGKQRVFWFVEGERERKGDPGKREGRKERPAEQKNKRGWLGSTKNGLSRTHGPTRATSDHHNR